MPDGGLSVVIPTCNRAGTLVRVLRALEAQTIGLRAFEVVVVDDGSQDDTPAVLERFVAHSALSLHYLRQQNRGPAAARNRGIATSTGSLLVLLGDDTFPAPDFLAEHLRRHHRHAWSPKVVVVGYTTWPAEMEVTPYVRYSGEYGPQFAFRAMLREAPCPYQFFYSSNVSVSRELLDSLEYPFDEDFTAAMYEDTELGYRLAKQGMELYFHPQAITYHDHPTTMLESCRRAQQTGAVLRLLIHKHPELGGESRNQAILQRLSWLRRIAMLALPLADLVDRRLRLPLPRFVYRCWWPRTLRKGPSAASVTGAGAPCIHLHRDPQATPWANAKLRLSPPSDLDPNLRPDRRSHCRLPEPFGRERARPGGLMGTVPIFVSYQPEASARLSHCAVLAYASGLYGTVNNSPLPFQAKDMVRNNFRTHHAPRDVSPSRGARGVRDIRKLFRAKS